MLEHFRFMMRVFRRDFHLRRDRMNEALMWITLGSLGLFVSLVILSPLIGAGGWTLYALTHERRGT